MLRRITHHFRNYMSKLEGLVQCLNLVYHLVGSKKAIGCGQFLNNLTSYQEQNHPSIELQLIMHPRLS